MEPCKLCQQPGAMGERGICDQCLEQLGFSIPIPRAVPRRGGCARCGDRTLIRVLLRDRAASYGSNAKLEPAAVTFGFDLTYGLRGRRPDEDPSKPIGILEAMICSACGFTDLYVQNPGAIPIGAEYGTELLEAAADAGAYR